MRLKGLLLLLLLMCLTFSFYGCNKIRDLRETYDDVTDVVDDIKDEENDAEDQDKGNNIFGGVFGGKQGEEQENDQSDEEEVVIIYDEEEVPAGSAGEDGDTSQESGSFEGFNVSGTLSEEGENLAWPKELTIIPQFEANLKNYMYFDNFWSLTFEDTNENAIKKYANAMEAMDYELSFELPSSEGLYYMFVKEIQSKEITVILTYADDQFSVSIGLSE